MGQPLQQSSNGPQESKVLKFAASSSRDHQNTSALQGWKAISAELNRGVRTVQRWESTLGLPVHRLGEGPSCPVFAFQDELQLWLRSKTARGSDRNDADDSSAKNHHKTVDAGRELQQFATAKVNRAGNSEPEIIKSLNAFFALKGSVHKESICESCSSSTRLLVGQFWLYGTDNAWQVSIPFCPQCDADVRALLPPTPGRIS
jgi:hypothetical protein